MKIKSIFIKNYKALKDFNIDFCDTEGIVNPITVISSINGSGKTTLLEFINYVFNEKKMPRSNSKSYINVIQDDLILGNANSNYRLTNEFLNYKRVSTYLLSNIFHYYKGNTINGLVSTQFADLAIVNFIDELIYEKDIRGSEAYNELRKILNEISKNLKLNVEFDHLDKNKEIYFKNEQSNKIKLEDLSDGEKEIITKIFPLYISNFKDNLILIDQPESSLHPTWQNEIINLYEEIAVKDNIQIIITTNSPHIISTVKKEYLKTLKKENGVIKVVE